MTASPGIRPIESTDLAELLQIERQAYPYPWSEQQFLDCLKANYRLEYLLSDQTTIRGYWVLQEILDELHILNFCIIPEFQGQGWGHFFLDWLVQQSQQQGFARLLLEVRRSNKAGRRLYQRQGFETIGTRNNYYPCSEQGREDALVMEHLIS